TIHHWEGWGASRAVPRSRPRTASRDNGRHGGRTSPCVHGAAPRRREKRFHNRPAAENSGVLAPPDCAARLRGRIRRAPWWVAPDRTARAAPETAGIRRKARDGALI